MTRERLQQDEKERRDAAAVWLARVHSGAATEEDWLAFEVWLADPANKEAADAIELVVDQIDARSDEIASALRRRSAGRRRAWGLGGAVGVVLAAALAIAILVPPILTPNAASIAYSAPVNAARMIELADGSSVHLNRGAAIDVLISGAERRISLTRGEAAFSVAHDTSRPLVVSVGDVSIRDIGTVFNVLKRANSLTVSVREGMVEMAAQGLQPIKVGAGDELVLSQTDKTAKFGHARADDAFAWQEGRLVFHDATLREVVDDLNRYAATPIRIIDPEAAGLRFSGALMIEDTTSMVSQLRAFLPVRSDMSNGEILLRGR